VRNYRLVSDSLGFISLEFHLLSPKALFAQMTSLSLLADFLRSICTYGPIFELIINVEAASGLAWKSGNPFLLLTHFLSDVYDSSDMSVPPPSFLFFLCFS